MGLFRGDENANWLPIASKLNNQSILALMVQAVPNLAGTDSILYIGTTRGVYRSVDRGVTIEGNSLIWGHGLEDLSVTAFLADDSKSATFVCWYGLCRRVSIYRQRCKLASYWPNRTRVMTLSMQWLGDHRASYLWSRPIVFGEASESMNNEQ